MAEAELIDYCQQQHLGWEQHLVVWLRSDSDWLLRRCAHRLGSVADAEDALQDITLKVMKSIGRFEKRSALRTWVICIADNHCNSLIKRRNNTAITDHMQHSILLIEHDRSDVSELNDDLLRSVSSSMGSLSAKNQEVLRLRFYADQSLDEMASALGLSLSATKMRLYRAMNAFKKRFLVIEKNSSDFCNCCDV